jgi:hypothetical protein
MWRFLIPLAALIVALVILTWMLLRQSTAANMALEVAKGLISLTIALIVTGFLSFAISERSRRQAKDDDLAKVYVGALQDLKVAFEKVSYSRYFLIAHTTALTFEQQIPAIAEARQRLQKVQRERYILGSPLERDFQTMLDYLSDLAREYRDNYDVILIESLRESAQRERIKRGEVAATTLEVCDLSNETDIFPCLSEFATRGEWRGSSFFLTYNTLKRELARKIQDR